MANFYFIEIHDNKFIEKFISLLSRYIKLRKYSRNYTFKNFLHVLNSYNSFAILIWMYDLY